jgi:glycosyltransferase involved in cell wall biosynthesis
MLLVVAGRLINPRDMPSLAQSHLILFFTRGASLHFWDRITLTFEREVAIYQRLQKQGVQVSFVTYGDAKDLRYAARLSGIRVLCNRWGLSRRRYQRWLPVLHGWHLWRADVYTTNQTVGADVALRTARLFGKPLIARCGYMWSRFAARRHGADSRAARYARTQEAQVFTGADRVVVTAGHMKQYVEEQYGVADSRVRVIPNYVLTDLFRPDSEGTCKPGRICFIGRLEPQKNLFALLEAVRGLDVELEIIGDGSQRKALEEAARDKEVNARFLGRRLHAELPQHLNAAEIFILPSLYEGHPKTLLEAMACGRPVIGTDVIGMRELIRHRETGYLCGTSPQEIRSVIQEVLANADLCARMGHNAREFVVEHFALERVVEMELALLSEVVGRQETGRQGDRETRG